MKKKLTAAVATAIMSVISVQNGVIWASTSQTAISVIDSKEINNLTKYLNALEQNSNFHGSVLVASKGKVILSKGYGMADYENKIPNTPETKFAIGSDTKQFTAMAIMQLQQKGLLNVNDKLSKYIPDFPNGNTITLHELLTHTSGIKDYINNSDILPLVLKTKGSMKEIIDILKKFPLDFKPGEKFSYSNSGYMLLTYIIEKVSKMNYSDYFKKNIFDVAGMKNTGVCLVGAESAFKGKGYGGGLEYKPYDSVILKALCYGAGSMYSTTGDMLLWDNALKTEKLLSKKYLNMMFTGYTDGMNLGKYGYGWFTDNTEFGKKIFHTGGIDSFTSINSMYTDKDLTIIILTNSNGIYIAPIEAEKNIAKILSGNEVALPAKKSVVKMDTKLYDSYEGNYDLDLNKTVKISISKEDNRLLANIPSLGLAEIFPEGTDKFFSKLFNYEISFKKDKTGKIQGLTFLMSGQLSNFTAEAQKVQQAPAIKTDIKELDTFTGEYELAPGAIVKITRDGSSLFAQLTGQEKYQIFQQSEFKFAYKIVDCQVTFLKDNKGKIISLVMEQGGQNMPAKKVK